MKRASKPHLTAAALTSCVLVALHYWGAPATGVSLINISDTHNVTTYYATK